jgi:hypothetical protein
LKYYPKENGNDNPKNKTGPKPRQINRDTIIEGICAIPGCENPFKKPFRDVVEKNGYCRQHGVEDANKKREVTCLLKHGCTNVTQSIDVQEKTKKTCLEKFGVEHALQSKEVKDKGKETNLKNLGVENPSQSKEIVLLKRQNSLASGNAVYTLSYLHTLLQHNNANANANAEHTDLTIRKDTEIKFTCSCGTAHTKTFRTIEKNGAFCEACQHVHATEQSIETNMKNRGVPYTMQDPSVVEKVTTTNRERFGGHPMQNAKIFEKCLKNGFKTKEYRFPSGRIDKIQGREHCALDELLQNGVTEEDIVTGGKNVPEVWWYDEKNTRHRYYTDIYIPSLNKCIEVKSDYTFEVDKNVTLLKQKATMDAGYTHEIWVYQQVGKLYKRVECIMALPR